jgi:hypothetical protein
MQGGAGIARGRVPPAELQMRHPARDVDQIEGSVADDLIGDVHLAAPGEASLRNHLDTLCGKL